MDLSKYPLEKLLHVVASVIPGFVALSIYGVAVPGVYRWFWSLGSFGYKTKLAIAVTLALLVGTTVNTLINWILYILGYTAGRLSRNQQAPPIAPWRDPAWRAALSSVLGTPPKDTEFWFPELYEFKREVVKSVPGPQVDLALAALEQARVQNEREDLEWRRWYDHYHRVILQPSDTDVVFYVQRGLQFNLQTAAVYALASLLFVPGIRHWWSIVPASFWTLALVAFEIGSTKNLSDRWSTLDRQITYLTELARRGDRPTVAGKS